MKKNIILAVTGASGIIYAHTLADTLANSADIELHMILSDAAHKVMKHEGNFTPQQLMGLSDHLHDEKDIAAPPASGSWQHHGMIVCPCSMASLASISNGLGTNLIHRAADVCLKENLPLILVPRETPLSTIHLKNMLAAKEAGATILPACPGFYHNPNNIGELAAHVAGKVLDQLNIEHNLYTRWGHQGK